MRQYELMVILDPELDDRTVQPSLERFLTGMGRRKFVLPLFQDLMAQGEWGQGHARRIYAKARPGYHSVTVGSVDAVVK